MTGDVVAKREVLTDVLRRDGHRELVDHAALAVADVAEVVQQDLAVLRGVEELGAVGQDGDAPAQRDRRRSEERGESCVESSCRTSS